MFPLRKSLSAVVAISLAAYGAAAQAKSGQTQTRKSGGPAVRTEMLVTTDWLAQHLSDPQVIILHVGGSKADYEGGHLPGARWLPLDAFIRNEAPGNELPANENIRKAFEDLGIGNTARVVLYANDWQPQAARAYFTLDYVGQAGRAALLDGGIEKWLMEKRPLSTETPTWPKSEFTITPNPGILATREQVEALAATATLLDARPLSRYRTGHIPGAATMFWEKNLVSDVMPVLSSPNDLRKKLEAVGMTSGKPSVVYCESGMQSSFAYFVTKYMGYDPVNYDGSMSDWKSQRKPMVKGDSRR